MSSEPCSKGFLDVNGLRLYHEVYGETRRGEAPLVLLHGGLRTIPEMMPWIEPLSKTRKVVALELQGHGRTADTDRPLALHTIGDDVAAVIDQLGLGRAEVAGYSFGADVSHTTGPKRSRSCRCPCSWSTPTTTRFRSSMSRTSTHFSVAASASQVSRTPSSRARLAIIPGYSHYNFFTSPEVAYSIGKYVQDPLDGTAGGAAAAASQTSP